MGQNQPANKSSVLLDKMKENPTVQRKRKIPEEQAETACSFKEKERPTSNSLSCS